MSEARDVPTSVFSPGDYPRVGDYLSTFTIPVIQLLKDKMIRAVSPQIYEAISVEAITIKDGGGRVIVVLTQGCFFESLTQEPELSWQPCRFKWSLK